jgi:hypothetical protein
MWAVQTRGKNHLLADTWHKETVSRFKDALNDKNLYLIIKRFEARQLIVAHHAGLYHSIQT